MDQSYSIVKLLGQGGFGRVFLVKNMAGEKFAIKSVSLNNPTKYILNEFQVMKNLNHPRIVKLIDFYPSSNAYNFVMEYAAHGSLRDLIHRESRQNSRIKTEFLLDFFMDIAYGVRYLHQKNIIHRDLKPENILICTGLRLKLCDFGISKVICDSNPQFQTSIGTLSYMSPEVYLHNPYDSSCDIWALGLIFYEMAFLKYMLTPADKSRILSSCIPFNCPFVNWNTRKYDQRLQKVLEMTVQRNPKRRYTADAICKDPMFIIHFDMRENETRAFNLATFNQIANNKRKSLPLLPKKVLS